MNNQPSTTSHLDIIDELQAEWRDQLGAKLAVHVREYACRYGEELAREFITQGFEGYHRDRIITATLEELDAVDLIWGDLLGGQV